MILAAIKDLKPIPNSRDELSEFREQAPEFQTSEVITHSDERTSSLPSFRSTINQIHDGDRSAFGELYDASYDTVYRFVYHRTLDTALTEDIVSTVYMKAIKNLRSLQATSEGEFFSWMLRIAYTTLVDTMRKVKPEDSLEDMIVEPGYERDISRDIDNRTKLEEVLSFMNTLSERDRAILSMRIWEERSYEEIAEITGESVANAKQIVSRSLAKIAANVSYLFIFSVLLSFLLSSR